MRPVRAVVLLSAMLLLQACAAGWSHTSDAALARRFESNEAEFESLRAEFEANPQLRALFAGDCQGLHQNNLSAMQLAGFPKERARRYEDQLQRLGVWSVIKGGRGIEFRVDPGSVSNGDSYKGIYWYREDEPRDVRPSLDDYRFSVKDEFVYKALKGHWHLYIFVAH